MFDLTNTKYKVKFTSRFKKEFKKVLKQGKEEIKLLELLNLLANGKELDPKYRNHKLINDKTFKDCSECHIEPDWLLIYYVENNTLTLVLSRLGSHSDLFS